MAAGLALEFEEAGKHKYSNSITSITFKNQKCPEGG
jgi:hypothetical protein